MRPSAPNSTRRTRRRGGHPSLARPRGRPRQDPSRNPSGLRHLPRQTSFSGVSWSAAAASRIPPASQRPARFEPWITHKSDPTGSWRRISSHGSSWRQAQRSIPTSRRLPPLPRRTRIAPRVLSRSVSWSASASLIRSPARHKSTISARRRCPCGRSPTCASPRRSPRLSVDPPDIARPCYAAAARGGIRASSPATGDGQPRPAARIDRPRSTTVSRRRCAASASSAGLTELRRPAPLDPRRHNREQFDSGAPVLDEWLRRYAGQNRRRDTAATWVIADPDDVVVAYASVSMTGIDRSTAPDVVAKGAPDPVPALLLGRLAVDRRYANLGIGIALAAHVLATTVELNEKAACRAVVVTALTAPASAGWERLGSPVRPGRARPAGSVPPHVRDRCDAPPAAVDQARRRPAPGCPRQVGVGRFVERMNGETREQVSLPAAAPEGVPWGMGLCSRFGWRPCDG